MLPVSFWPSSPRRRAWAGRWPGVGQLRTLVRSVRAADLRWMRALATFSSSRRKRPAAVTGSRYYMAGSWHKADVGRAKTQAASRRCKVRYSSERDAKLSGIESEARGAGPPAGVGAGVSPQPRRRYAEHRRHAVKVFVDGAGGRPTAPGGVCRAEAAPRSVAHRGAKTVAALRAREGEWESRHVSERAILLIFLRTQRVLCTLENLSIGTS